MKSYTYTLSAEHTSSKNFLTCCSERCPGFRCCGWGGIVLNTSGYAIPVKPGHFFSPSPSILLNMTVKFSNQKKHKQNVRTTSSAHSLSTARWVSVCSNILPSNITDAVTDYTFHRYVLSTIISASDMTVTDLVSHRWYTQYPGLPSHVISLLSYALFTGSGSLNASNTSSSHLPTKISQLPNLRTFITSSPLNVLAVLALQPLLLLLGHFHHPL